MVKCADCGYLAVRHRETCELTDAEEQLRLTGELPVFSGNRGYIYDEIPICFVRAYDFRNQLTNGSGGVNRKQVLNQERECGKFTAWNQGFTPKQHVEMQILEQQNLWQQHRDEEQRAWQAAESLKSDERHRDTVRLAKSETRWNVWGMMITAIIGAMAAIGAVCIGSLLGR